MNPIQLIFDKISAAHLWEKKLCLKRNEFLHKQGSIDTKLYYVQRGSLRIFVIDALEEHTIRFGYRGNLIAALDSFITEQPSELYIQALKSTELLVIGKAAFMDMLNSSPDNLQLWHKMLEQMVYQQMERERDILTASPLERYQRVLKRSPQLFQEVAHKYIASYLRMSPETLSRLKKS
ncbi:CRP-like cAMP-binding protein [Catalinimonas alkaloidigena]|uniref:Crp/Fnr family transcriptional regulator n=1 Tax=Catalinimonas alkaloidigena TaxID=1075417 RepID=UPI0024051494|nr:Crp/Fnr family transcriptional regulator [Catalinimonas alkaloidigena]MDF9797058.1 CRP-like cAMP-binding protein [Catalinimonas alkaloidigena]